MKLKKMIILAVLVSMFSLTSCKNNHSTEVDSSDIQSSSVMEITEQEETAIEEVTDPAVYSDAEEESIDDTPLFSLYTLDSQAENSQQVEVTEYEYIKDELNGGIEITKYNGTDSEIIIPQSIDGLNVTAIGESAFEDNENIVSVTISNTVMDIKTNAFRNCSNLVEVKFEDNSQIDGIWTGAFELTALKEFTVPENCRYVQAAFTMSYDIKKFVVLGENTRLGNREFSLPLDVIVYAPEHSEAAKYISVHTIYTFKPIDELSQQIEVVEYEYIKDELNGGIEITKYNGTDSEIIIPQSIDGLNVTAIGESAFEDNENIVSVTISNTVMNIKTNAFHNCSNLVEVKFEDNSQIDGIWTGAFELTALKEFTVPENCRYVQAAFDMSYDIKKFIVLGKNTQLDNREFSLPLNVVVYFPRGSQAETNITLHSPYNWKYLDELEE